MGYCKISVCRHNGEPEGSTWRDNHKVCKYKCRYKDSPLDLAKEMLNVRAVPIKKTTIIKYGDKMLRLESGKSSWRSIGAARSALTNSFYGSAKSLGFIDAKHMREVLEKEGIIKFEQL